MSRKAVGYCRFSSENQADGFSIEAQKNAINEFAAREGYEMVRFYVDEAKSGTKMEGRDAFQEMLNDSKKKEFETVIVHKLDRFARSRVDSAIAKRVLKDNGVSLISVLEFLDDSPESVILESVLEGMAEYYSKNLSREVKKGMRVLMDKGKAPGKTPYGYNIIDGFFSINEKEAEVVRFIFAECLRGVSLRVIGDELTEKGIRTRFGSTFAQNTLHNIILNTAYIGEYRFGDRMIPTPPLVSREEFARADEGLRARLRNPEAPRGRKRKDGCAYVLTGLVWHKNGEAMIGYSSKKKGKLYRFYRSRSKGPRSTIRRDTLESLVIDALFDFLSSDDTVDKVLKAINEERAKEAQTGDEPSLRKDLRVAQERLDKLLDLYLDGGLDKKVYAEKKAQLDQDVRVAQAKLSAVRNGGQINAKLLKKAFAHYLGKLKSGSESPAALKATLRTFIQRIEVDTESSMVSIAFRFEGDNGVATMRDVSMPLLELVAYYSYESTGDDLKVLLTQVDLSSQPHPCC